MGKFCSPKIVFYRKWVNNWELIGLIFVLLAGCSIVSPGINRSIQPETTPLTPTPSGFATLEQPTPSASTNVVPTKETLLPTKTPTPSTLSLPPLSDPIIYKRPYRISNLIFLLGSDLYQWNRSNGQIELLSDRVADFSLSQSSSKIALLKSQGVVANAEEVFDLSILDAKEKTEILILQHTPRLQNLSISPDGNWVSYQEKKESGDIILIQTSPPYTQSQIGLCIIESGITCDQAIWSPDSQSIAWSDDRGVWRHRLEKGVTNQVSGTQYEIVDPEGQSTTLKVKTRLNSWSPDSRFLLGFLSPMGSETNWGVLIDTRSDRIIQIKGTLDINQPEYQLLWLSDGSLLGIFPDPQDNPQPTVKRWEVVSTRNDVLSLIGQYNIPYDVFPQYIRKTDLNQSLISWPGQIDARQVGFGIISGSEKEAGTLPIIDLFNGKWNKIYDLSPDTKQILWAPDGSGALFISKNGDFIFTPWDGSEPINLTGMIDPKALRIQWQAPLQRS